VVRPAQHCAVLQDAAGQRSGAADHIVEPRVAIIYLFLLWLDL
jgi:hypothetical protein